VAKKYRSLDEKLAILRAVQNSPQGTLQTLDELGVASSSYYDWLATLNPDNGTDPDKLPMPAEGRKRQPAPPANLRAAVFDIETTDFDAGGYFGHLVCCSILPLDTDDITTHVIQLADQRDDSRLLKNVMQELSQFGILIGHNIAGFDLLWLWSRCMYWGLDTPGACYRFDTYQVARTLGIKAGSKKMSALCDFFRVPYIKTAVQRTTWSLIDSPYEDEFNKTRDEIVYHCEEDVKANRLLFNEVYHRVRSVGGAAPLKLTNWRGVQPPAEASDD
jgi:hypothetical protein